MTEPVPPISPPPSRPFAAEPAGAPGGCGKPVLIGCGVLAILLGIAAVVFVLKAKSLLAFALEKLQAEVVASLPEDVDAGERARLEAAFDGTLEKIASGQIDPGALQTLQAKLVAAAEAASQDRLTREQVVALTRALEAFAGIETPAEEPAEEGAPPAARDPASETPEESPPRSQPVAA